jgi:predicted ester cyclase
MEQLKKNKEFVVRYFNAMSGITKTPELCQQFLSDEELIEHIAFFDTVFPKYEIFADEMIAEGNKVVVRGRLKGRHEGVLNGIPPTYKDVNFPFVISYEIENNKIVHHWLIADQAAMMEQLGLVGVAQE